MICLLDISADNTSLYSLNLNRKNVFIEKYDTYDKGLNNIDGLFEALLEANENAADYKYYYMINDNAIIYRCVELSPLTVSVDLNKAKKMTPEILEDLNMLALDNMPASCNKVDYTANIITMKYNASRNLYYLTIAYIKTDILNELKEASYAAGIDIFGIYTFDFGIYNILDIVTETIVLLNEISLLANDYGYLVLRSCDAAEQQAAILKANAERAFGNLEEYTLTDTITTVDLFKKSKFNINLTTTENDVTHLLAAAGIVIFAEAKNNSALLKNIDKNIIKEGKLKNGLQTIRQLFNS